MATQAERISDLEKRVTVLEHPGVLWYADLNKPVEQSGFHVQAKYRTRVTQANGAVRLQTKPGDDNLYGSGENERCDLMLPQDLTDGYEGSEAWWHHEILFPDDYVDPPQSELGGMWNWGALGGFHNSNPGSGQGNFTILAMPKTAISPDRPTGLNLVIAFGEQDNSRSITYSVGPILRNVVYAFDYHVQWSLNGFFDAWVNGVKKMDYRGPTIYPGQGVYLKLANYHSPHGQPSAVLHSEIRRGSQRM